MRFTINAPWLPMAALLSVAAIPAQAESLFLEVVSEPGIFCPHIVNSDSKASYAASTEEQAQSIHETYSCEYYKPDAKQLDRLSADGIQRTKPMVKESHTTQTIKRSVDDLNRQGEKPVSQKPAMNHYHLQK